MSSKPWSEIQSLIMGGSVSKRKEIANRQEMEETDQPNSLYDAIIRNDLSQCVLAIEDGIDINEELKFSYGRADGRRTFCKFIRTYALHLACIHRRETIVELLLDYGAHPCLEDYMKRQPVSLVLLYWPRIHYFEDCTGLSKRENDYQLYLKQQHRKSENCLISLLKHGVNPDQVCMYHEGQTPLLLCAKYNLKCAIRVLIENGANINVRDINRRTPLILATKMGNFAAVEELLRSGADVRATDESGCTAAHYASAIDTTASTSLLKWIMEYGADVNCPDSDGNTPLHFAAQSGRENCIDLLLNYMADPDVRNNNGETPLFALINQNSSSCSYAFNRLVSESRQPSILNNEKLFPSHLDTPAYLPHADNLLNYSVNPSTLTWLCRHTIRRCLGKSRLNTTDVWSLPCPNLYKHDVLLNKDVLT